MPGSIAESEGDYDPREHQPCYIFTPANIQPPPAKRRKVEPATGKRGRKGRNTRIIPDEEENVEVENVEGEAPCPFPRLLDGEEPAAMAVRRWETYNRLWRNIEETVEDVLEGMDVGAVNGICKFVAEASEQRPESNQQQELEDLEMNGEEAEEEEENLFDEDDEAETTIRTGLVLAGPNIASHSVLFAKVKARIAQEGVGRVILLTSSDSGGIKGILKKIVKEGTQGEASGEEEDEVDVGRDRSGKKLLNYDLQILVDWVSKKGNQAGKIVVAIQDTEAFDPNILAQLVDLMIAYLNRIPFVLLLGVATSIDITQSKLPKSTIRKLDCKKFDVERAEECLDEVFKHAVIGGVDEILPPAIHLGPNICDLLIKRQNEYTISIQGFISALKFVYMTHFFGNPLSVILGFESEEDLNNVLTPVHIKAIRNLQSFRRLVEHHLSKKETHVVRLLLSDDDYLKTRIHHTLIRSQEHALQASLIISIFKTARSFTYVSSMPLPPLPELHIKLLTGTFHNSSTVREFLMAVKKLNSHKLTDFLRTLTTQYPKSPLSEELVKYLAGLETLLRDLPSHARSIPLQLPTSSRLVPAPSTPSDALGEKTVLFNHIISQVHTTLQNFFSSQSILLRDTNGTGIENGFLSEVICYDWVSPSRECFMPNIRGVVEGAIFNPKDWLPCECCPGDDESDEESEDEDGAENEDGKESRKRKKDQGEMGVLSATQPATTVLYRLYCESGALINMYDLWQAFWSIVGGDDDEEEESQDGEKGMTKELAQALFYRGVAELRFLGFVKYTKRKRDCLAKLAWKGL
ncbi:hypothetical protein BJ508DRAFT_414781 [Ascobolus immersus RN42]|uniref:Uncharacterized protein n=1 Tax=Ascobolus immersus RN42 TaxID=1160509 RepID=A0A3N4I5H0_ASCIM|nr:hypothetical protein BJ508DRAFT_414781 [Ascobolus immersus RN42]